MYTLLLAAAVASAALPDSAASAPVPMPARLHGKVTDFHGNPLAGVRVTVAEFSRLVLTDQEGNYALGQPAERHLQRDLCAARLRAAVAARRAGHGRPDAQRHPQRIARRTPAAAGDRQPQCVDGAHVAPAGLGAGRCEARRPITRPTSARRSTKSPASPRGPQAPASASRSFAACRPTTCWSSPTASAPTRSSGPTSTAPTSRRPTPSGSRSSRARPACCTAPMP